MDTRKLICNEIKKMSTEEIEHSIETLKEIITEREHYRGVCFRNPALKQENAFNHYSEVKIGSVYISYHSDYREYGQFCGFTSTILFDDEVTTLRKIKTILDELQNYKPMGNI